MKIEFKKSNPKVDLQSKFDRCSIVIDSLNIYAFGLYKNIVNDFEQYFRDRVSSIQSFTPQFVNQLFKDFPAHYYLLVNEGDKWTLISDPYALLKLYLLESTDTLVLSDDYLNLTDYNVKFTVNEQALKFQFLNSYTPSRHTIINEISKVPPSTIRIFSNDGYEDQSYLLLNSEAQFDGEKMVDEFEKDMQRCIDFFGKYYDKKSLFLSGGMDSSFLLNFLINSGVPPDKLNAMTGKMSGLGQSELIDNDYDILFSEKLSKDQGVKHQILDYDYSSERVLDDFLLLRDNLHNDYAPAVGYVGFSEAIPDDGSIVINGQNADSILSFGGSGHPFFKGGKLQGLAGFFSRDFQFFHGEKRGFFQKIVARFLMNLYYKKNYGLSASDFSDKDYLLGIAMNPKNYPYWEKDERFDSIKDIGELAKWMNEEYINPIINANPGLSYHGYFELIYQNTYMQGGANRGALLSGQLKNKNVVLPYTDISLLEKMVMLKPNWNFVYYGKYPNYKISVNKLKLPKYITERSDPVGSDSTTILYNTLLENKRFLNFIKKSISNVDWDTYVNVLSPKVIGRIQLGMDKLEEKDLPFLMKLVWNDTILKKFRIS